MRKLRIWMVGHPGAPCQELVQSLQESEGLDVRMHAQEPEDDFLTEAMAEPPDLVILAGAGHDSDGVQLLSRLDYMGLRPAVVACVEGGRPSSLPYEPGSMLTFLDPAETPATAAEQIVEAIERAAKAGEAALTVADYLDLCRCFELTIRVEGRVDDDQEMVLDVVSGEVWSALVGDQDGEAALASVVDAVPARIVVCALRRPPVQRQIGVQTGGESRAQTQADEGRSSDGEPDPRKLRLLLLEPEAATVGRKLEAEGLVSLQGWHLELIHETSLATAAAWLERDEIDLVVLDLALSGKPELETFGQLRTRVPRTPAVVVSDFENLELGFKALERGAQECLLAEQIDSLLVASILVLAKKRHEIASLWSAETLEAQTREADLRGVLGSDDNGVVVLEAGGDVLFHNPRAEELVDLTDPEMRAQLATRPATATGRHPDGCPLELAVQATVTSWSGRPAILLRLRPAGDALDASSAARDDLILTLTNEQRGVLAAHKGFLDLLRKGKVEEAEVQQELFETMHQQTERLSSLIDALPGLLKMTEGRLDPTMSDVDGVISEALLGVPAPADDPELEALFAAPAGPLDVRGDRDR